MPEIGATKIAVAKISALQTAAAKIGESESRTMADDVPKIGLHETSAVE